MTVALRRPERPLTDTEVGGALARGLEELGLDGRRVLLIIPDGTRSAPLPLFVDLVQRLLAPRVAALDYLVALGTHPPMSDLALSGLLGVPVRSGMAGETRVLNHLWDRPDTFTTVGTIPAGEVAEASQGRLAMDVPVRLNRLVCGAAGGSPYDHLLVLGPVFPHEVASFSGGNKYFLPGVAGPEIIDVPHWLGALLTCRAVIGVTDTPVRRLIDRAAELIPTPRSCIALVMHGRQLHGVSIGSMTEAWRDAARLAAELDIVEVERPFRRVLSMIPAMYEDLWTAAKGMYKLEGVIEDGGEVVLYAPHVREVSRVHGRHLEDVGYHVRDFFLAHWERYRDRPWGVLAHSTHLRGDGTYEGGVERPRIRVTLATGIPRERCERVGLGYLDPHTIDPEEWADLEEDGVLLVREAGEILYRVTSSGERAPGAAPRKGR